MALSYPDLVPDVTDAPSWLNTLKSRLLAYVNSFPGANIQAGTVAQTALAKGKAFFAKDYYVADNLTTANVSNLVGWKFGDIDGASGTSFKYLGASIAFRTVGTALGAGALIVLKKNGVAIHSIPVDSTVISAAGGSTELRIGTPEACASGDVFTVDFTAAASGNITGVSLSFDFSLNHVGT